MKDRQFFENLDTSFIKLEALVRYLRRRSFIGTINVKYTGYIGEITFTSENKLRVTEQDQIAGRVTGGQMAFKSIIARSGEPGGIINVVQSLNAPKPEPANEEFDANPGGNVVDILNANGKRNTGIIPHVRIEPKLIKPKEPRRRSMLSQHADFPFDLSNHVELRAEGGQDIPDAALELMIDVTSDLLSMIDNSLQRAGLDFHAALERACADVSANYPFLDPRKRHFRYSQGFVYIKPDIDLKHLTTGIGDALARIFERLGASPKFGKVHRFAVQKVRQLMHTRKLEFEQTGLIGDVERAIAS